MKTSICLFFFTVTLLICGCGSTSNITALSLTSANLNFGVTLVGTSVTQTAAVVVNTGNTTVTLSPVVNSDTNFSIVSSGGCGTSLAPGAQCNLLVQYAPAIGSTPVQETATINLRAQGLTSAIPQAIAVSGTPGVPSLKLSASSYNFGQLLVGTTASQTAAVVTNSGNVPLALAPMLAGNPSFTLVSGGCAAQLLPGASCNVVVKFAPPTTSTIAPQVATVNLGISHLLPGMADVVTVTGTPGVPSLKLSASSYDFGQLLVGTTASQTAAVATNTGNVSLTLAPMLAGNASFTLVSGGCRAQLLPGASCNVLVKFAPPTTSTVGQQTATVNLGVSNLLPGTADAVTVTGTPGVPSLTLSASSYDFGQQLVGTTAVQTTTVVTNTGNTVMALAPAVSGTTDFRLVAGGCGTSLAVGAKCNVVVQFAPQATSSPVQESATIRLGAQPQLPGVVHAIAVTGTPGVPAIALSASSYSFGDLLVGGSLTQTAAMVTNTGNVPLTLKPVLSGDAGFSLAAGGCGTQLAIGATCDVVVQYAPTVASSPALQSATVNLGVQSLAPGMPEAVAVSGMSGTISGTVTTTANAMVAKYTLILPFAGTWNVSFGTDTGYGLTTSTVTAGAAGATSVFVAGMLPNTTYHMRATVTLSNGQTGNDVDHTFASGALPAGIPATFPVTLGVGTPQPGIELMDPIINSIPTSLIATDLKGNTIWAYKPVPTTGTPFVYPQRLLPNGDLLMYISPNSYPLGAAGTDVVREIDLAGDTVRELSMANLNIAMAKAGFPVVLGYFTHDFTPLPNGHLLVMANTSKAFTNLPGFPGVTNVVGDVVIDLDPSWNPVWVWSEFDHFDVNRHPMQFPDWTHSNSLSYSTDDGDFIVSMRHQNWVAKVDYQDGKGTGNVVWKLGEGGDFKLVGAVDPTDWFYAQHDVKYVGKGTTGVFSITVMDNGDDRMFPTGVTCGTTGQPPCHYTTIQELQLDERAMTATFQFHQILPPSLYSLYGGNVEVLANGNVEYSLSGIMTGSEVFEVTPGSNPQTVWHMTTPGSLGYRAFRLPSLYPGVQW